MSKQPQDEVKKALKVIHSSNTTQEFISRQLQVYENQRHRDHPQRIRQIPVHLRLYLQACEQQASRDNIHRIWGLKKDSATKSGNTHILKSRRKTKTDRAKPVKTSNNEQHITHGGIISIGTPVSAGKAETAGKRLNKMNRGLESKAFAGASRKLAIAETLYSHYSDSNDLCLKLDGDHVLQKLARMLEDLLRQFKGIEQTKGELNQANSKVTRAKELYKNAEYNQESWEYTMWTPLSPRMAMSPTSGSKAMQGEVSILQKQAEDCQRKYNDATKKYHQVQHTLTNTRTTLEALLDDFERQCPLLHEILSQLTSQLQVLEATDTLSMGEMSDKVVNATQLLHMYQKERDLIEIRMKTSVKAMNLWQTRQAQAAKE